MSRYAAQYLWISQETFINVPVLSERFSMASSMQYHQLLPSLKDLIAYIQEKICPTGDVDCRTEVGGILSASYVDIDFDTISHALTLSIFWESSPAGTWSETIKRRQKSDTVEIGVLNTEKAKDP